MTKRNRLKTMTPEELLGHACVVHDLSYHYHIGSKKILILDHVNFAVKKGERVALMGVSGAGKSTLLHLMGLLDTPASGDILVEDINVSGLSDYRRTLLRRRHFGFIFQFHHLLPELNTEENVIFPQLLANVPPETAQANARDLLKKVGLGHRLTHKPSELSGGEQQRAAIARALANQPRMLLADEPTGSLDEKTSESVMTLIMNMAEEHKMALFIVTHNRDIAQKQGRILRLARGSVEEGG